MNYQKVIDYKLQMIIDLMLTDGVSPSELSDNIFEKEYISISFSKTNRYIVGKLNFYENENVLQTIQMFYTYSFDKKLIRIEEEENGNRHLLWDRQKREEELIEELLYFLNYCYDNNQMAKFVASLPDNLRNKIQEHILDMGA